MRDFQRSKVYKLDNKMMGIALLKDCPYETRLSLPVMQGIADELFSTLGIGKAPEVKDGRRCRSALGSKYWVKMPRWSRNHVILCHELAHSYIHRLDERETKYAAHGPEYMGVYVSFLLRLGIFAPSEIKALADEIGVEIDWVFMLEPEQQRQQVA